MIIFNDIYNRHANIKLGDDNSRWVVLLLITIINTVHR
jgi:hypothetical protein